MTTEKCVVTRNPSGHYFEARPTNVEEAWWKYSWSISRRPKSSRGTDKKCNLSCKRVIKNLRKTTSKSHSMVFFPFSQVTLHVLHCFHGFCFFKVLPLAILSARSCPVFATSKISEQCRYFHSIAHRQLFSLFVGNFCEVCGVKCIE